MASYVLTNAGIWLDQHNLQGDFNTVSIASEVEEKDATVFGDTTRRMMGGLKVVSVSGAGFWNAEVSIPQGVDQAMYPRVGSGSTALTIAPQTTTEGDPAFFVQPNVLRYEFSPQIGEVKPFSFGAVSKDGPLVRGTILHNTTRTTNGAGTAFNLGAASSTQKLYAALHVLSVSGTSPTLDVLVVSDDSSGMTSPITRITFSTITARGVQWATPVSGPITDTWWRASWTITGTSPSFAFVLAFGIL